jgi:hypothetical protein
MRWVAVLAVVSAMGSGAPLLAQSPDQKQGGSECPPVVDKGEPPTVGQGSSGPLSDKLARSKGVICPPAGVDPEIQVTPPGGGRLKVIPPPGAPGGDQSLQPK